MSTANATACVVFLSVYSLLITGCQEFQEFIDQEITDSGRVVDGAYKNRFLDLQIALPHGWIPLPESQVKEWKRVGDSIGSEKGHPVNELTLFAYWNTKQDLIQLSCVEKRHFSRLRSQEDYAKFLDSVMSIVLKERGTSFVSNVSDILINGEEFSTLQVTYFGPDEEIVFVQDLYFKYYSHFVLTLILRYKENDEKEVLYKSLNSLELNAGIKYLDIDI